MRVLVVDDEEDICRLIQRALLVQEIATLVEYECDLETGIAKAAVENAYDLLLLDLVYKYPPSNARETLERVEKAQLKLPILIVSGMPKEAIESMVGPLTRPFCDKDRLFHRGKLMSALTEAIYFFKPKIPDRTKVLEDKLSALQNLLDHQI